MVYTTVTVLREPPSDRDYTLLSEHQSYTPASFALEESPVLYFKSANAVIQSSQPLPHVGAPDKLLADVYVSSADVSFWFSDFSVGLSVPYPSITLHAIQSSFGSVYLQIESPGLVESVDGEDSLVELTFDLTDKLEVQPLYNALSECSSLHPDVDSDEDEDENGAGFDIDDNGWITSDSLQTGQGDDEVAIDSEPGDGPTPAGLEVEVDAAVAAGQRRARDDAEPEDETKWRRVAGDEQ